MSKKTSRSTRSCCCNWGITCKHIQESLPDGDQRVGYVRPEIKRDMLVGDSSEARNVRRFLFRLQKYIGAHSKHISNLSLSRPLAPEEVSKEKIFFCIAKHHFHPVLLEMQQGRKGRRGMSWTDPIHPQIAPQCSISDTQDMAHGGGFLKVANISKASLQAELLTLSSSRRGRAKHREKRAEAAPQEEECPLPNREQKSKFLTPPYSPSGDTMTEFKLEHKPPPIPTQKHQSKTLPPLLPSRLQWCESTISRSKSKNRRDSRGMGIFHFQRVAARQL